MGNGGKLCNVMHACIGVRGRGCVGSPADAEGGCVAECNETYTVNTLCTKVMRMSVRRVELRGRVSKGESTGVWCRV